MTRAAWQTALVLSTLIVLVILWEFRGVMLIFLASLVLNAAFYPFIANLVKHGISQKLALAALSALLFLVIAVLFLVAAEPLLSDLQKVSDDALASFENTKNNWQEQPNEILSSLANQMPSTQALSDALTKGQSLKTFQVVFGATQSVLDFLTQLLIIFVLSLYWSAGSVHFERLWLSILPVEYRSRARKIWHNIEKGSGQLVRRELLLSLLTGICLWLGYAALGLHYPTLIAALGALIRLIPWLGPILMVFFPAIVGSSLGGWASLTAAIYTALVLSLLENTIGKQIFPRQAYSSLLLIIIMMMLTDLGGLFLTIFAPLLTLVIQILFKNLLTTSASEAALIPQASLDNLQIKMEEIQALAESLDGPYAANSVNLAARLERLIEKSISVQNSS